MKVEKQTLANILDGTVSYVVPLFQRGYVWKKENWQTLWEDVVRTAEEAQYKQYAQHFIGASVFEQLPTGAGHMFRTQIIDGQQRLTTIQIALRAFRDVLEDLELQEDYLAGIENYIFNKGLKVKQASDKFKVWPTTVDQKPFMEVITQGNGTSANNEKTIFTEAYEFFTEEIKQWLDDDAQNVNYEDKAVSLLDVFEKRLVLAVINLEDDDDSQEIFETLNALGTPLRASDLVKNHIFRLADAEAFDVSSLYEQYWKSIDDEYKFWFKERSVGRFKRTEIDIFLQYYLSIKTASDVAGAAVFRTFRNYISELEGYTSEDILSELVDYANLYRSFFSKPSDTREYRFFERLKTLEIGAVYPLIIWFYANQEDQEEREKLLDIFESYLVRRAITLLTTQNYNRMVVDIVNRLKDRKPKAADVESVLKELESPNSMWPDDETVISSLMNKPLYGYLRQDRLALILSVINEHLHHEKSEFVQINGKLQIEHIMPQNWSEWPLPPGNKIEKNEERKQLINTIGNLTIITGKLNAALSNGPWEQKKNGLNEYSNLRLNRELLQNENWNEEKIKERSKRLAHIICEIWRKE